MEFCGFVGSRALALADPYCHIAWNSVGLLVRERSALADPYCHLAWNSLSGFVCWFASASFSGPLLSVSVEFCWFASASFSGPLLSVDVEFCLFVCVFVCPQL